MKKLILAATFAMLVVGAQAQQPTLANLVKEAGAEWTIGRWAGETPDGQTMKFSLSWDLDQRVVFHHGDSFGTITKGFTGVDPVSGEVKQFAFDREGNMVTGEWSAEGSDIVLKLHWKDREGQAGQMALVHTKGDDDTMKVRAYELGAGGERVEPARRDFVFKRQK